MRSRKNGCFMSDKILHIGDCDKFIPPYIEFVKENFDFSKHEFLLTDGMAKKNLIPDSNIRLLKNSKLGKLKHYLLVLIKMNRADKIILHNLFDLKIVFLLFFMPWLLKKCYWIMWGADLYVYQFGERNWKWKIKEFLRRPVIKRMGFFSTTVPGDFDLVKKIYGTNAKFIHNLMYPSHLSRNLDEIVCNQDKQGEVFVQVGNSADPSNNHFEVLEILSKLDLKHVKVFCPLSYGSEKHREEVIEYGNKLLGEKFIPITDFMSFTEYNSYMACIDIAIFNHNRQQAMGNTIGLLSLGKKVVMKSNVTPFEFFKDIGVKIYQLNDSALLTPISNNVQKENIGIMKKYFHIQRLYSNWEEIFNEK